MIFKLKFWFALVIYFPAQFGCVGSSPVRDLKQYPSFFEDTLQETLNPEEGIIKPLDAHEPAHPRNGTRLLKPSSGGAKWIATCDNDQSDADCFKVIDGVGTTSWRSKPPDKLPIKHEVTIDLRAPKNVNGVRLDPGAGAAGGGAIVGHEIYLGLAGGKWARTPVAFGSWLADETVKFAVFEPHQAQFVRIVATSSSNKAAFITIAEIDIWTVDSIPASIGGGRWGSTIDFPIVPVAVFVEPLHQKVVSFASSTPNSDDRHKKGLGTWASVWDRDQNTLSEKWENIGHDMFCPGTSFDVNGTMIVTGGGMKSAGKTSGYDAKTDKWLDELGEMNIRRGYQGSTTRSDGQIFVIGGSWGPGETSFRNRFGEIYDPFNTTWKVLNGCPSAAIETDDHYREYRADNHVWMLGWKDKKIFHAGPSKTMHWISTEADGSMTVAGIRARENTAAKDAKDAMCGIAAMYDAEEGKILTAGGAPSYEWFKRCDAKFEVVNPDCNKKEVVGKPASSDSFVITLGAINGVVTVVPTNNSMHYPRTFLNAVILPNGDTFVAGGMEHGEPFSDETAKYCPETYHPETGKWELMACNSIPRTYHSFGLLLPDATVLVGGGGLDGQNDINHLDAQIFTPPYLVGKKDRPKMEKPLPDDRVHLGAMLTVTTDKKLGSASLVRYSGATHTVNNDQRRVKLHRPEPTMSGKNFEYKFQMPKDPGVAIPGYWMLFVMDEDGVPSVAHTLLILCHECSIMKEKHN